MILQGVVALAIANSAAYYLTCSNGPLCTCGAHPLDDQDTIWANCLLYCLLVHPGQYILYYEGPVSLTNPRYTVCDISKPTASKFIYLVTSITASVASLLLVHGSARDPSSSPWPTIVHGLSIANPLLLIQGVLREQLLASTRTSSTVPGTPATPTTDTASGIPPPPPLVLPIPSTLPPV